MMIEDPETKRNVDVVIELTLKLSKDMFENLHKKAKESYEAELIQTKKTMAATFEIIKQICDCFKDIMFDDQKMCFYNEKEEIRKWELEEGNLPISEANKLKRDGCDCCIII